MVCRAIETTRHSDSKLRDKLTVNFETVRDDNSQRVAEGSSGVIGKCFSPTLSAQTRSVLCVV
jgi:hypothetical protein